MTFGYFRCSSQSLPWYITGLAANIPDFLAMCNSMYTWDISNSLRIPYLIPLSLAVYFASAIYSQHRQVATRAAFLGILTGLGCCICVGGQSSYQGLGLYIGCLAWFHFSEYLFTEIYNADKVKLSSFMLNHSPAYNIALTFSLFEFFVERSLYPGLKEMRIPITLGFMLCVIGDFLRKRAMCVAGPNFNHIVQDDLRKEPHTLVTSDVYHYIQHPSYTGWFIFIIGTQVVLMNPLCLATFPYVMYRFFEERVKHEEPALESKYGTKYKFYKENTSRFIPYIW